MMDNIYVYGFNVQYILCESVIMGLLLNLRMHVFDVILEILWGDSIMTHICL